MERKENIGNEMFEKYIQSLNINLFTIEQDAAVDDAHADGVDYSKIRMLNCSLRSFFPTVYFVLS